MEISFPRSMLEVFPGRVSGIGVCTNRDSARKCTGGEIFLRIFSGALELCRISCGLQRGSWERQLGGGKEIQKYTRKLTEF